MLDEAIANLTCSLKSNGLYNNTIIVIAGDNGGEGLINGTSYPFRGNKFDTYNGGVRTNAFIHSPLISESLRGKTYEGKMHVTDWLPTLMGLATNNEWSNTTEIDGLDQWSSILYNTASPRNEIIHYIYDEDTFTIEADGIKMVTETLKKIISPTEVFNQDLYPDNARTLCSLYTEVAEISKDTMTQFYESSKKTLLKTYINLLFLLLIIFFIMLTSIYILLVICRTNHRTTPHKKYTYRYQSIGDDKYIP
jgi:arylsulfatase A-like enzyme